jgi:hypothetical protein
MFFKRRRSRLADSISNAQLGPLAGAPRRPTLELTDKDYAHVRYAERLFSLASDGEQHHHPDRPT